MSQQKKPEQQSSDQISSAKQQKLQTLCKWLDAGCGAVLMLNGVLRYIFFTTMVSEPWTFFQPAYMILFGSVILGSNFNVIFILSRVSFMQHYLGRGILDIFVATICSSYLGSSGLNILAIILTIFLFIVGLMYLCFHFTGLTIYLPPELDDVQSNKKKNDLPVTNHNLDNSQNLGRGLSDSQHDPSNVYSNGQI